MQHICKNHKAIHNDRNQIGGCPGSVEDQPWGKGQTRSAFSLWWYFKTYQIEHFKYVQFKKSFISIWNKNEKQWNCFNDDNTITCYLLYFHFIDFKIKHITLPTLSKKAMHAITMLKIMLLIRYNNQHSWSECLAWTTNYVSLLQS